MVFNATFNNISIISWQSVLLVEEMDYLEKTGTVLASSAVERGFEPRLSQTKDYIISICCFSAKHTALRCRSKDWLARNRENVSEWSDMSTRRLLFQ
jgi:hypothetical protein